MVTGTEDIVTTVDAGSVLRLFPTTPRLLALGEPTHGEPALLERRNDLFRELVEQRGYRTIALETDCLRGLVVDDHVTTGRGDLDAVVEAGFSHEWGAFPANRELVRWMRDHNEGRPPDEQVRFAGFDGPLEITGGASPRPVLTALHGYLSARLDAALLPGTADALDHLLGADDRWTEPAAMRDPSASVGRSPEAVRLRVLADDLVALLEAQAPHLIAVSTTDEWERARLYGRTATGLLRYHFWMADASPGRLSWLLAVRDGMMAVNLLALAERGPTLANGHNGHLQRAKSTMRMGGRLVEWWGAGATVSARRGPAYGFLASALGTLHHRGVEAPDPDTVEGRLYALPQPDGLVDPRRLAAALPGTPPARVSTWFGYAPLDPAQLTSIDGIVFVRDAHPG